MGTMVCGTRPHRFANQMRGPLRRSPGHQKNQPKNHRNPPTRPPRRKRRKKKNKKIMKKCKKDPKLTACKKLDGLKNEYKKMKSGGNRSDEFDIVGGPDVDEFPDFSAEFDGSRKCEKRAWRSFCAENPLNVYC